MKELDLKEVLDRLRLQFNAIAALLTPEQYRLVKQFSKLTIHEKIDSAVKQRKEWQTYQLNEPDNSARKAQNIN